MHHAYYTPETVQNPHSFSFCINRKISANKVHLESSPKLSRESSLIA